MREELEPLDVVGVLGRAAGRLTGSSETCVAFSCAEGLGVSARRKRSFERVFGTLGCLKDQINSDYTIDLTRFLFVSTRWP